MSRSYPWLVLLLIALAPLPADAQQPYLDPSLRKLLRPETRDALARAQRLDPNAQGREQAQAGINLATPTGEPLVDVLVKLRNPAGLDELRAAGAEIGTVIGNFVAARVPLAALDALSRSPSFEGFEASRRIKVSHDSSMRAIKADRVRHWNGSTWAGTTGHGVIVGIYDTGIDFFHEDFRDADGKTRILALWDQRAGRICTQADIQAAIDGNPAACPQRDLNGHGTHVAGTAAGDGSATGRNGTARQYAGVAPAADLIVVKGGDDSFSESRIIQGVAWIADQARALGKPAVVNLSLGGDYGAHDGTGYVEQMLDALSGPGFIVVVAAGNSGANNNTTPPDAAPLLIHGMADPAATPSASFTFTIPAHVPNAGSCNDSTVIGLWYEAADRLEITVSRPDGSSLTAGHGEHRESDSPTGRIEIDNGSGGVNPENSAYEALITISDCGASGSPASGTWTLRVEAVTAASGKPYHLWIYTSQHGNTSAYGQVGFDNAYLVGPPGSAKRVITVGAFVSRLCWPTVDRSSPTGQYCWAAREQLGDIAFFSSGGPTRDGRLKPEIAAPGRTIVSALSRDASAPIQLIAPDSVHVALQGTSMAAPHVTGAIALMLQHAPNLTPEEVKAHLAATAVQDAFTRHAYTGEPDGVPNNQWGYGKLDVEALIRAVASTDEIVAIRLTPQTDTLPVGASVQFQATAVNAAGGTIPGVVIDWASSDTAVAQVSPGGLVTARALGSATITASAGTVSAAAPIQVVPPATLLVRADPVPPPASVLSQKGTRLTLLRVGLRVDGHEAVDLHTLGFDVRGADPQARLLVIDDANRDGNAGPQERTVGSATAALQPDTATRVEVSFDSLRVAAHDSAQILVTLELSGATPNQTVFQAALVPEASHSVGVRSNAQDRLEHMVGAPSTVQTTVLRPGEIFTLSENPVRSGRPLIFNFSERPRVAAVYTLGGRRVVDLLARMSSDNRVAWDLTNDEGSPIAPGVYLAVFDVAGTVIREKLFIVRPAVASGGQE